MLPRLLSLLLLLLVSAFAAQAQDVLTKQSGEEIAVKVLEISPTGVTYRRTDNPDGPLITVRKTDVFMIRYANGTKEVFDVGNAPRSLPAGPPAPAGQTYSGPAVPGDELLTEPTVNLGGPRIGFTVLTGGAADKARKDFKLNPFLTQFGWQFETRIFRLSSGLSGLVEVVPLIGGLEQGKFIPSLNALVGIRGPKGFEFGLGPNITPAGANIALAIGTSFKVEDVNFPVNLAVVPGNGGVRFSLLLGFNYRRR
ncbi:hypothetical protein D0N36_15300 [Hymenobacter lapidiphilus]|uniref:hypothetical protein n=1 Tax=Hymenobacter sp. CCM 8763 TaxID=2303334 RepID=UPI000E353756|nr:hypothetical protein [Hymenobacter sp. CCM 8763]RFP64182.1 hypothetical protein D0N36_15300 [Hymenobacter sp. CCM 8763]